MVLEQFFKAKWLEKRPAISLLLGFVFVFIGLITALIFFRNDVSIALLFLVTLLLVPSLMKVISLEEKVERKFGVKHFFKTHRAIFEIYFFLFIGILAAYLVIGFGAGDNLESISEEQMKVLNSQGLIADDIIDFGYSEKFDNFLGIFTANLLVALIFFVLSVFYGAGGIFLIVWNASIFSTFIVMTLNNLSRGVPQAMGLLGAFSLHLIPEVFGFLVAAIAGGVVSRALIKEKLKGKGFSNVVKDATLLLLVSFAVLLVAAALEAFVSTGLVGGLV
ncbi:MAG: stage II sporulation protein M [Nanoarchaeota archaeon]|nr:stage II sporulation protein M [Nanoarchaeota archaeon]